MKPDGQVHVPEAEQTPEPEHGGEHEADSMSRSEREPAVPEGSCETSGTESQRIMRLFEDPEDTAAQTFEESASELAESGVPDELLPTGVVGRLENPAWPEYSDSE